MGGPRYYPVSPEFVTGETGTTTRVVKERTRHGKVRWKIMTVKSTIYLTTNQTEALADALDDALDWHFDGDPELEPPE